MTRQSVPMWRPVQAGGRIPFVVCVVCRARELNETNRLKRAGWQETTGGPRVFRCEACTTGVGQMSARPSPRNPPPPRREKDVETGRAGRKSPSLSTGNPPPAVLLPTTGRPR